MTCTKHTKRIVLATAVLLIAGLLAGSALAGDDKKKDADKPYKLTIEVKKTDTGGEVQFVFDVVKKGFHLDKNAPMKIKLKAPEGVTFADNPLRWKQAIEYKPEKRGIIKTTYTGEAGKKIKADLKFAICNETNCFIKREKREFVLK